MYYIVTLVSGDRSRAKHGTWIWITLAWVLFGYIVSTTLCQPVCNIETSDFAEIVRSPCFVDKTLLITEVLKDPKVKYITTPRRFGKTTNLDMVRRFIQINVDDEGQPVNIRKTTNYKIFQNKSLKIHQHRTVYKTHFGKYPVVYIDYEPLSAVISYESMLETYRQILLNMFEPHTYLIENQELWGEEHLKEEFIRYVHPKWHLQLKSADIRNGFSFLLELLHKHFNKPLYIIIDDFDSYVESLMFQNVPDIDIIYTFIHSINHNLLMDNDKVQGVLITGVMQILDKPGVTNYHFLRDHPYSEYFGFTYEEVKEVVRVLLPELSNVEDKMRELVKYYNGYNVLNRETKLFVPWSVLNNLINGSSLDNIRSRRDFLDSFKAILNIPDIAKPLGNIVLGRPINFNASYIFKSDDIFALNDLVNRVRVKNKSVRALYFNYLYQIGYVTPISSRNRMDTCVVPNTEVLNEIKTFLNRFSTRSKLVTVGEKVVTIGESE